MGTLESQHDPGLSIHPALGHPEFPVVPHPAHKVPHTDILSDVIETGGHRHHDGVSSLRKDVQ